LLTNEHALQFEKSCIDAVCSWMILVWFQYVSIMFPIVSFTGVVVQCFSQVLFFEYFTGDLISFVLI